MTNRGNPESRRWIIGEALGEEEERLGEPFIGRSGDLLRNTLSSFNSSIDNYYVDNIYPYRPPNNNFDLVRNTPKLTESINTLKEKIERYKPELILCLGAIPLEFLYNKKSIISWAGSIVQYNNDTKLLFNLHPAFILRTPKLQPIFSFFIERFINDDLSPPEAIETIVCEDDKYVGDILKAEYLACDIESKRNSLEIVCHGFAVSGGRAYVFHHTASTLPIINLIYSSTTPKVFHNGFFYDIIMLQENKITVNNVIGDTIIQAHVINPDLPRDLGLLTSVYTRQPYYKKTLDTNEKAWSEKVITRSINDLYVYNAKDCCVTHQIYSKQQKIIEEENLKSFYEYKLKCAQAALQLSMTGMLVNPARIFQIEQGLEASLNRLQQVINTLAGYEVNVNSPKQVKELLYGWLRLKPQKSREGKITIDNTALVNLLALTKQQVEKAKTERSIREAKVNFVIIKCIQEYKKKHKILSSYIKAKLLSGKHHSVFMSSNTETDRWGASKYVDGSGLSLQTIPRGVVDI